MKFLKNFSIVFSIFVFFENISSTQLESTYNTHNTPISFNTYNDTNTYTFRKNETNNHTNQLSSDTNSYAEELYPMMIGLWFCFVIAMIIVWKAYYTENKFALVSDSKSINNIKNESTPI